MTIGDKFPKEETLFHSRTVTILDELERLKKEESRPSTALQAKTLSLQIQLALKRYKKEPIDEVLIDLQNVIQQAEKFPGYPLEPLVEILTELGEFLEGEAAYEALFETIVKISSSHKGEISAARMLLIRGEQQLNAHRPYEAIRSLGRTFTSLYKHESRRDAIFALYLCACAYEQVGLLWAAHGTMLNAVSLAINDYWKYGDITPLQAACCSRLKWIELQLGRIPHILVWHEIDTTLRTALIEQGYEQLYLTERDRAFDAILGMLLLRTDIWDLRKLTRLPDTLEKLDLLYASISLIYALGHEEEILDDEWRSVWGNEDAQSVFSKMYNQPASEDLPEKPLIYNESKVYLTSSVLGCEIIVESENTSPCMELSESILAALEGLLSTGVTKKIAAREPTMSLNIRKSEFAKTPFEFKVQDETGVPTIIVACSSFDPHSMPVEKQGEIKEKLLELVSTIIARCMMIPDIDETLQELFYEEHGLDRSISFTGSFLTIGNVLGYTPKTNLSDWLDTEAKEYRLMRSETWNADLLNEKDRVNSKSTKSSFTLDDSDDEIHPDLFDPEKTKHTQIKTVSLVREVLWDKAKWSGTAFLEFGDFSKPPILAPIFKNQEAAKQIFEQWRDELGIKDETNKLRISIIRGIDKKNPYFYRVVIGSNPDTSFPNSDIKYAFFINRVQTMEPSSNENLERFLQRYNTFGQYLFMPAIANTDLSSIEPILDHFIIKNDLYIKEAWNISRNDIESSAIYSTDEPIIPSEVKDPPVLKLLQLKRDKPI